MAFVKAVPLADLPPGCVIAFRQGEADIAVCNVAGEIHAVDNRCPHAGGPLAMGALHGKMLVCPWHAWEFDCTTGECDFKPEVTIARYAVRQADGFVEIDLPASAGGAAE